MLWRVFQGVRRQGKKLAQLARIQARGELHIPTPADAPDDEQDDFNATLAALGLEPGDADGAAPKEQKCYLWPENVRTFGIWQGVQTQWRVGGMGSVTGLDYAAVLAYLREVAGLKRGAAKDIFGQLQAMEAAVLGEWARQRE